MAKIAELPDGTRLEFPDDAPDEIIGAKVKEYLGVSTPKPMSWADAASQGFQNIPQNAGEYGKGLLEAVTSPVQTAKAIGSVVSGGLESMLPEGSSISRENVPAFEALVQSIKDRYGSEDALKNSIANHPVETLADFAGLLTGVGGVAGKLPMMAKVGGAVSKVGSVIDPLNVARQAATLPLRAVPTSVAQRLWTSAVKPSLKDFPTLDARSTLFKTAYENNIPPSMGGLQKARGLMDSIDDQIAGALAEGGRQGDTVNSLEVASRVGDLIPYYQNQAVPSQFLSKLDEVQQGFLNEHPSEIPVQRAQEMKKNIYHENRKKYGETRTAGDEAEKAIARGLKEELVAKYPELSNLNKKYSDLIDLDGVIEKAVERIGNHQLLGLTTGLWGGAGYAAGDLPGMTAAVAMKAIMDNPQVKGRLALALARARNMPNLGTKGSLPRAAALNANEATKEERNR